MVITLSTWEEAILFNQDCPHGDIISNENGKVMHKVISRGDFVDPRTCEFFKCFYHFVIEQQTLRRSTGKVSQHWSDFCIHRERDPASLGPRWTLPFCYFDKKYSQCFVDTIGLDVGCNIASFSSRKFSDRFIDSAKKLSDYFWEYEIFVPHYQYYQKLGCRMQGIDIHPTRFNIDVTCGDLRMLIFDEGIIDFFTIAMIMGPGNPACTYLDVALCMAELKRTCNRNGLIYIADFIVMPALVTCAIYAGFRVFTNNSYQHGIPIGIFLIRNDANIEKSRFHSIIEHLIPYELMIPNGDQVRILNRELLKRNSAPTKVELLGNN